MWNRRVPTAACDSKGHAQTDPPGGVMTPGYVAAWTLPRAMRASYAVLPAPDVGTQIVWFRLFPLACRRLLFRVLEIGRICQLLSLAGADPRREYKKPAGLLYSLQGYVLRPMRRRVRHRTRTPTVDVDDDSDVLIVLLPFWFLLKLSVPFLCKGRDAARFCAMPFGLYVSLLSVF